ncbi:MAG: TonB family protein [Acidobacteria bacterium]|nr:TonB family protein [Acidobacteriota bacterium]
MRIGQIILASLILSLSFLSAAAQDAGAPAAGRSISGGVLNGKATNLVKPPYPAAAKAVRAEGTVNVQVTIDEEGNVVSATAVSGHPLLRANAVQAARQSKFSPTTLEGKPVKVTGVIVYNFALPKEPRTERLVPMAISMFLTALREIPTDEETEQILRRIANVVPPGLNVQKSQFERLARARTSADKGLIVDEIIDALRRDSTGTDVWAIDFGKQWGAALGEAYKIMASDYQRDRRSFVKNLQAMNWLLETPPKDISEETLDKIRAFASYNNESDAISPEFIGNFLKTSLDFMQYMIDAGKTGK